MDIEQALDFSTLVSISGTIRECRKHSIVADYDDLELFDARSGEVIARLQNGMVRSRDVMCWLGY